MNKLKGRYISFYRKASGTTMYVYAVSGTPEAIEAYKQAKGDYLRHEDNDPEKAPLFFTNRASVDNTVDIVETRSGNWVIDDSEIQRIANVTAQFGGNFGEVYAMQALANRKGASAPTQSVQATAPQATIQDPEGK